MPIIKISSALLQRPHEYENCTQYRDISSFNTRLDNIGGIDLLLAHCAGLSGYFVDIHKHSPTSNQHTKPGQWTFSAFELRRGSERRHPTMCNEFCMIFHLQSLRFARFVQARG